MERHLTPLVLALFSLATPSCFLSRTRINESIDTEAYARLLPGTSTQDDVLHELGAPSDIVQLGTRSAWRYDHTQSKSSAVWPIVVVLQNVDTVQDRVWAFFDADGLLTHLGGTFQADDASYKMPFQD
jgi:outer membrane protein assembly factor BamE (lipoprotein component of BamABCDE complex)